MDLNRVRPHFQNAVPTKAVSSDGVTIDDLGVNPLSVIYLMIRPLNDTGTLANFARYLNVCSAVNQLRVLYRGASIVSMSGVDLAAMNLLRRNVEPRDPNSGGTNNDRRCVCLPIMLGRFAGDPSDCFPAVSRGQLSIEIDWDIADTGYDGLTYSIETLEILGASPVSYERSVTIARTQILGQNDVNLPVGWDLRGVLCFGTTGFAGATPSPSISNLSLLLDNQQYWAASVDFESLFVMNSVLGGRQPTADLHEHTSATTSPTTNAYDFGKGGWENYGFLDFDLLRNDAYSVPTAGANAVLLRSIAKTADAVRYVPVERVMVSK